MSYLTVIPLADAKTYLRIDDTQNETDAEITRMINAACSFVEKRSNYRFFAKDRQYVLSSGSARVYDYPINSDTTVPADIQKTVRHSYTLYETGTDTETITLNVGFTDAADVPPELVSAAYEVLNFLYYGQEDNKTVLDLSADILTLIDSNRRFVL